MLNRLVAKTLPWMPRSLVGTVARRYIAGDDLDAARATVEGLVDQGFNATIDILGEDVETPDEADRSVAAYLELLAAIPSWRGGAERVSVSLKPTQFGLRADASAAHARVAHVAQAAADRGVFVRLDMEDASTTDAILASYRALRERHPGGVGCVLQATLFRTRLDAAALAGEPHHDVRLCKGIYVEPPDRAWQEYEGVRLNYMAVARILLEGGVRLRLATHDAALIAGGRRLVAELGLPAAHVEFQALLGVPILKTLSELRAAGHPVRLYVPFGPAWYAYSLRRLKENPSMAGAVLRGLVSRQR